MNKIVSATEFKAKCLKMIADMEKDGKSITITKRGKVVAEVNPAEAGVKEKLPSSFGILKSDRYRFEIDPSEPACDPDDWEALR